MLPPGGALRWKVEEENGGRRKMRPWRGKFIFISVNHCTLGTMSVAHYAHFNGLIQGWNQPINKKVLWSKKIPKDSMKNTSQIKSVFIILFLLFLSCYLSKTWGWYKCIHVAARHARMRYIHLIPSTFPLPKVFA